MTNYTIKLWACPTLAFQMVGRRALIAPRVGRPRDKNIKFLAFLWRKRMLGDTNRGLAAKAIWVVSVTGEGPTQAESWYRLPSYM